MTIGKLDPGCDFVRRGGRRGRMDTAPFDEFDCDRRQRIWVRHPRTATQEAADVKFPDGMSFADPEGMILITGANGNVGTELVRRLHSLRIDFRAAYHSAERAARARAAGIDSTVIDYADSGSLDDAMRGIEKLFLVCPAGPELPAYEANAVNAAIRAGGIRQIVKCSVWDAETEAFTLARIHRQSEKTIEYSGIPFTHLRPNSYMQNFVNYFADPIRSHGVFQIPGRDSRCSFVDVRDVARVAATVLLSTDGFDRAYSLSGPEALTYGQVALKFSNVLGRKISYRDIPDEEFRRVTISHGGSSWLAEAMIELYHYAIAGHGADLTSSVQEMLGQPPTSFDQFARDYIDAFRATKLRVSA